jgi:hypothetical protein
MNQIQRRSRGNFNTFGEQANEPPAKSSNKPPKTPLAVC